MSRRNCIMSLLISFPLNVGYATTFPPNTEYEICFTPQYFCSGIIVKQINDSKRSVQVQAYSFTLDAVKQALVKAHDRNVNVQVILDRTQEHKIGAYFAAYGIPVWIDYRPAIAHNKVMIIDGQTVITGSFNFTNAAQERNAENVLVVHDRFLASQYQGNWKHRQDLSRRIIK